MTTRVHLSPMLEIILRDEKLHLWPLDQRGEDDQSSLFPDGRSDDRFVKVVESGEPWRDIC